MTGIERHSRALDILGMASYSLLVLLVTLAWVYVPAWTHRHQTCRRLRMGAGGRATMPNSRDQKSKLTYRWARKGSHRRESSLRRGTKLWVRSSLGGRRVRWTAPNRWTAVTAAPADATNRVDLAIEHGGR
jgi:sarcosine oxidase gamma subunit